MIEDFLNKFLPDCAEKKEQYLSDWFKSYKSGERTSRLMAALDFDDVYFDEALKNFADKLCAEQRANCAELFLHQTAVLGETENDRIYNCLKEAEQPTVDEISL
jgi:cytochrome c553